MQPLLFAQLADACQGGLLTKGFSAALVMVLLGILSVWVMHKKSKQTKWLKLVLQSLILITSLLVAWFAWLSIDGFCF
jgi:ABC-type spermidine/putrescine transport system permease subunit I